MVEKKFCDVCGREMDDDNHYYSDDFDGLNTIVNAIVKERKDICKVCLKEIEPLFFQLRTNLKTKLKCKDVAKRGMEDKDG